MELRSDAAKASKPLSVQNQHHLMQRHSGSQSVQTSRQQPSRFRLILRASGPEWKLAGRALLTTAWSKAKCCLGDEAVEKNLFVLLPRQQAVDRWGGRVGDLRGRRGRRKEEDCRRVEGERFREGKMRGWQVIVAVVGGRVEIWAPALLFTPSLPCLCWLDLSCVGEFTVFCNLIPNKVSQQILLSQKNPFFPLWKKGSSNRNTEMTSPMRPVLFTCISLLPDCLPPLQLTPWSYSSSSSSPPRHHPEPLL